MGRIRGTGRLQPSAVSYQLSLSAHSFQPIASFQFPVRDTAPRVGSTSERRDTRQHQNGVAGARSGGADDTRRVPAHPSGEQSAHRRSGKPAAPPSREANPGGPVCHAAKREAQLEVAWAASGEPVGFSHLLSAISCQLSAISSQLSVPSRQFPALGAGHGASSCADL